MILCLLLVTSICQMWWKNFSDDDNILYPSNAISFQENLLQSFLCSDLSQMNHYANYMGRWLDLVFPNDPDKITLFESDVPVVKVDTPHNPLEICLHIFTQNTVTSIQPSVRYNFARADFNALNAFINS